MKKFVFIISLIAVALLSSCNNGGGDNPEPVINTYKLTFDCENCKVFDENNNEVTSVDITTAYSPYITYYKKFYFKSADSDNYYLPLECDVSIKNGEESIKDYSYNASTGELIVPIIGNLNIVAPGFKKDKTLEECTWSEINEISTTRRAEESFKIGDIKKVQLKHQDTNKDGTDVISEGELYQTVRIVGFNQDKDEDGNKIGITFEFANLITDTNGSAIIKQWNNKQDTISTNYDYRESTLNDFLNNTMDIDSIINMFPDNLKEVVKPVNKKVGVSTDSGDSYIATSFDGEEHSYPYLFPLSYDELTKTHDDYVADDEGTTYEYYQCHDSLDSRIKKTVDGSKEFYWIRSPNIRDIASAWSVGDNGALYGNSIVYYFAFAIAPAFCI